MSTPRRTTWLAGAAAVILMLVMSGIVFGRADLKTNSDPVTDVTQPAPVATTASFEDLNGNGIDDDCEANVVADPAAAAAAELAVDENADGDISVSEAAHSDRTGGTNCNHGGYVSWVAQGSPAPTAETTTEAAAPQTECTPVAPPERDPALDAQKNGHGKWVSTVAQSEATGGKNCNHGGAVSEAAKKDHGAAAAARAAAKAEREAARAAAKAAKQATKKPH